MCTLCDDVVILKACLDLEFLQLDIITCPFLFWNHEKVICAIVIFGEVQISPVSQANTIHLKEI